MNIPNSSAYQEADYPPDTPGVIGGYHTAEGATDPEGVGIPTEEAEDRHEGLDVDQLVLDYQDALARLSGIRTAILRRDDLAAYVRQLESQLKVAKSRLKEAGWDLANRITVERRGAMREGKS